MSDAARAMSIVGSMRSGEASDSFDKRLTGARLQTGLFDIFDRLVVELGRQNLAGGLLELATCMMFLVDGNSSAGAFEIFDKAVIASSHDDGCSIAESSHRFDDTNGSAVIGDSDHDGLGS